MDQMGRNRARNLPHVSMRPCYHHEGKLIPACWPVAMTGDIDACTCGDGTPSIIDDLIQRLDATERRLVRISERVEKRGYQP